VTSQYVVVEVVDEVNVDDDVDVLVADVLVEVV